MPRRLRPRIRYAIVLALPAICWPEMECNMPDDIDAAVAAALDDPPRIQRVRIDPRSVVERHRRKLQELAQQGSPAKQPTSDVDPDEPC